MDQCEQSPHIEEHIKITTQAYKHSLTLCLLFVAMTMHGHTNAFLYSCASVEGEQQSLEKSHTVIPLLSL